MASAGDVNGDGHADVVVGARYYDTGETDEGRAYVLHGTPAALVASPAWTAESDQADAELGFAVAGAGDVYGYGACGDERDCADTAPAVHPSAPGACDGTDDDWDGSTDEDSDADASSRGGSP